MKIAIATGTRADWGLLSPLAKSLRDSGKAEVTVIATNMHLMSQYGMTINEIITDGFHPMRVEVDGDAASITAQTLTGFSKIFRTNRPEAVVILGDRHEMLGVAIAAMLAGVPIVHIAGGTVSEGAYDDQVRNAITKMASLHLVETDDCRRRVVQMGENPEDVITTGAIGVSNLMAGDLMSRDELEQDLEFDFGERSLLVTLHAATLDTVSPEERLNALLQALDTIPDVKILFTHPNNDVDSSRMLAMIADYGACNPERVKIVPSLGRRRYLSALKCVNGVVGNSSSGIVEVPSAHIPTLDIGIRQQGRTRAQSVVHCDADTESISAGLKAILSNEIQTLARTCTNPYSRPDTIRLMIEAILSRNFKPWQHKSFYDIEVDASKL